jgi:isopentenyl diphosphate isomerase/L-lactate dehydrogenase-like FMN-dependent dehydrogenase
MANKDTKTVIEIASEERADRAALADPTPEVVVEVSRDDAYERPPRKYSKRYRRIQEVERSVSKAIHRLVRSAEAGVSEWREQTDRSSRKRRDGAIRDALENFAKATGTTIRAASRTPEDVVRVVRKMKVGRFVRRIIPI